MAVVVPVHSAVVCHSDTSVASGTRTLGGIATARPPSWPRGLDATDRSRRSVGWAYDALAARVALLVGGKRSERQSKARVWAVVPLVRSLAGAVFAVLRHCVMLWNVALQARWAVGGACTTGLSRVRCRVFGVWRSLVWVAFLVSAFGCAPEGRLGGGGIEFPPAPLQLGAFTVEWTGRGWSDAAIVVRHPANAHPVWETIPGRAFVTAGKGREKVHESRGLFLIEDRRTTQCSDQLVEEIVASEGELRVRGTLLCGATTTGYVWSLKVEHDRVLRFELLLEDPVFQRVGLVYRSDPGERVFGFGEQFTYLDLKGRRVPIFVSEQGIGRGLQPVTALLDLVAGAGGSWHTTYAPVPHYLTSRMRSLALENSEYASFDFRAPDCVQVEVWSNQLRGRLYAGSTPLELIEAHTGAFGRMRRLPEWVHRGAIVGMQGGTERVRAVWEELAARQTPIAAFWLQDWVGQRATTFGKQLWWNWELDRDRYPQWESLVADLAAAGIRMMTYVNPFLVDVAEKPGHRRNLFWEAAQAGYLVRRADGKPYMIRNTTFSAGLLDVTNPEAREWFLQVLRDQVLGAGVSGWMADFGEGLPYDAVLHAGEAPVVHNRYPELWAEWNREAIVRAGREEDGVFFMRSGFTRSPAWSTLFWLGDQLVTWDQYDGLKSAVHGLLSSGLSGFAFNHSDIGGYTTINHPLLRIRRSRELLLRWMEFAAFQVVFRTHEGNLPEANHQFYSDPETLSRFSEYAKLFASWKSYRTWLIDEAARSGAPIVRPLFLHYPSDPRAWDLGSREFLVGPDLFVAPVLDPGVERVQAYLPQGRWVHLWSGTVFEGPRDVEVAAPIGKPAVFYREGAPVGEQLVAYRNAVAN
jgi:alpha-glucosidase